MSYGDVSGHGRMVFDQVRNEAYAAALRARVSPESVLLDLGAGLGLHGLLAAAAGARRVYLVEPEPVLRLAMEAAQALGLADRVVPLQGRIEDVRLPEAVDGLVSVFTGNLLYSEDLLPSLFLARDRHLKPGGFMLPDRAELMLAPVRAEALHRHHVARWSDLVQGIDYSAARRFAANEIVWLGRDPFEAVRLAAPLAIDRLDLARDSRADCRGEEEAVVTDGGPCHGLLGWIRIRLGEHWISSDPEGPPVHWGPAWLPFDQALELRAGEAVRLRIDRPKGGEWTWGLGGSSGSRRQSTALAHVDAAERLRRLAPTHKPALSPRGRLLLRALTAMDGRRDAREIANALRAAAPEQLGNDADALAYVQALMRRHAA